MPEPRTHISVYTRKGYVSIPIGDVIYFWHNCKYTTMRHTQGEILMEESLKSLEREFGDLFIRVHRNALVAWKYIKRFEGSYPDPYRIYMKGCDEPLDVSRRHATGVMHVVKILKDMRGLI